MLSIPVSSGSRFCDGISRRNFLKIGALGLGGLTLPQLLRAENASGIRKSHKAVIMIYLPGGPPHQDMYDIKVDAPSEIRGEFRPISTNVPGIQICEHLPKMAAMMDKLAPIRSIVGGVDEHTDFMCLTGRTSRNQPPGGWPSFGSVVSKVLARPILPFRRSSAWNRRCSTSPTTLPRPVSSASAIVRFIPKARARTT